MRAAGQPTIAFAAGDIDDVETGEQSRWSRMTDAGGPPDPEGLAEILGASHRTFVAGNAADRDRAFLDMVTLYDAGGEVLPMLLALVNDPDPHVRAGVADVLPFADPEASADGDTVMALLALTRDGEARVRDFAATALGHLDQADSPDIRDALRRLLNEPDTKAAYPAAEAAWALAVRHDPAVIPVIKSRLDDTAGKLWLTAAAATESPLLLDALHALVEPDEDGSDPWVLALHEAIASCTPVE